MRPAAFASSGNSLAFRNPVRTAIEIDARLRAKHAEHELLPRHLEREDPDADLALDRGVLRDAERERRLTHRRSPGDDDQIRALEPGGLPIEIGEAGRDAGHHLLPLVHLLDVLEGLAHQVARADEPLADLLLGDLEDRVLRLVDERVDVLLSLVGARDDLGRRADQPAENGFLADDPRVVTDVRRGHGAIGELAHVGRAADLGELAARLQDLRDGDEVDRLLSFDEIERGAEDFAMRLAVEVVAGDDLDDAVERGRVEEDAAEHGDLRLEALRRDLAGCRHW